MKITSKTLGIVCLVFIGLALICADRMGSEEHGPAVVAWFWSSVACLSLGLVFTLAFIIRRYKEKCGRDV